MLIAIVIFLSALALVAVMIRPYWGALLIWPVLLFYPHALTQDMLPFNIGFDDIFVAFVFLVTIVWRSARGNLRFGKWGMFLLGYWLLLVISSFYGLAYQGAEGAIGIVTKALVKSSTVVMIGVITLNSADNLDELSRLVRWFFIGSIGLSILAIVQYFSPGLVASFYQIENVAAGAEVWRATGSTRGPWEIGGLLGISVVLSVAFLVLVKGIISRPLPMACAIVSFVAVVLSRSRAGWLLMAVGIFAILIFGKKPVTTIIVVAVVASVMLLFPFLSEITAQRVEQAGTVGDWGESVTARFMIWEKMLSNLSMGSIIVGIGRTGAWARYGHTAHNYYVAVLVETGLVGILYFILLGSSLWRQTRMNMRLEEHPTLIALWKGIFSVNVGVLFYSMPVETLDVDLVAKALFFIWSMLYLRDYLEANDYVYESEEQEIYEYEPYVEVT